MIDTELTAVDLVSVETVDGALALFLGAELAEAHALGDWVIVWQTETKAYLVSG